MTDRLYYRDSYLSSFQATVRSTQAWREKIALELDRTSFYPTSGGQPADRGHLNETSVLDVLDQDGRLLHVVPATNLQVGCRVRGEIEWPRRFDHMQQHTGQHVLSQAFLRVLDAETTSFHLGRDSCAIDLDRESLTPEEIYQVEDLANQVLFENRSIHIRFIDSAAQNQFPVRKLSARSGEVRIVEIDDFDYSPCGGTHCRNTAEIGLIKIRKWERAKKQARVEFYCGGRALRDYRWKNRAVYRLSRLFSVTDTQILEAARQMQDREAVARKRIAQVEDQLLELEGQLLLQKCDRRGGLELICKIFTGRHVKELKALAGKISRDGTARIVLFGLRAERPALVFACSRDVPFDMSQWIAEVAPLIEGRGGGQAWQAQAGGDRVEGLDQALAAAAKRAGTDSDPPEAKEV